MAKESETKRAERIIAIRDAELSKQANFRNLWQDTADWEFPMFAKIQTERIPGEPLGVTLHDITARTSGRDMASDLSSLTIPTGQEFFALNTGGELQDDAEVVDYLGQLTEDVHEEMFASNFIEEYNQALESLIFFGNASVLPNWTVKTGLRYRSYPIGSYQMRADSDGIIDTMILTVKRTARQLQQQFPNTIGPFVKKALEDATRNNETNQIFQIIQIVQPRAEFNSRLVDNLNMPVESVYIGELDRNILQEGGFESFPFAMPRWFRSPGETEGRGIGTEILPQVRKLNQMEADKTQAGNRWVEPPLEVLESFDGNVNLSPRAQNFVMEANSIKAIDLGAKGSYPIAREELAEQRTLIQEAYFKSAFSPLGGLTGDRRTTEEIRGRLTEALKKLSNPLGRLFSELLDPLIQRSVFLLITNRIVRQPPPQLTTVKIEYTGRLALALRDQHVIAADTWLGFLERMEVMAPGVSDNAEFDQMARDVGRFLGVKGTHIRPVGPRDSMRTERARLEEEAIALEKAQVLAQGYGQTVKKPEEGSAAQELQEVA